MKIGNFLWKSQTKHSVSLPKLNLLPNPFTIVLLACFSAEFKRKKQQKTIYEQATHDVLLYSLRNPKFFRCNLTIKFCESPCMAEVYVAYRLYKSQQHKVSLTFGIQHFGNIQMLLCDFHGQVNISYWVILHETQHKQFFKMYFWTGHMNNIFYIPDLGKTSSHPHTTIIV